MLTGRLVRIRPGGPGDAARLRAVLADPSVSRWWGEPNPQAVLEEDMRGGDDTVLLVMEVDRSASCASTSGAATASSMTAC